MSKIVVRCGEKWLKADNLKTLKTLTELGFSEISQRIKSGKPVAEFILFLNDYDEIENLLIRFMEQSEERQLPYELYELSENDNFYAIIEPEKYKITSRLLRNIFKGSEETRRQFEREDELGFGCAE